MKNTQISKEYAELLDINNIMSNTPNANKLKVTLKKDDVKGTGIYATKVIKKGELIAYYRMKIFDYRVYESPTNNVYTFDIYTKTGNGSKILVGDIDLTSFPKPVKNIPFWAPFANEPMPNQKLNAEIDVNLQENYKTRKIARAGQYMTYKLVATRLINPGDEITIYYGKDYARSYYLDIEKFEKEE